MYSDGEGTKKKKKEKSLSCGVTEKEKSCHYTPERYMHK